MGFDYGNLYELVEAEWLPHENVKKGSGLNMKLNLDFITVEYTEMVEEYFAKWLEETRLKDAKLPTKKDIEKIITNEISTSSDGKVQPSRYLELVDSRYRAELKNNGKEYFSLEGERFEIRINSMVLGGLPENEDPKKRIIHSWDLMRDGKPVEPSFEELSCLSLRSLQALKNFVSEAGDIKKQKEKTSKDTSTSRK